MSQVLILSEHDIESMLPIGECIGAMRDALSALARGEVHQPLRSIVRGPDANGLLGLMPAWRGGDSPHYGLKEVCVFPGNPARGLDTHLGAVLLHDGSTGELLAIANGSAITAIRTAAVSAVATELLARKDATRLAIIGAGVQGRRHAAAIPLVRDIKEVSVFSRTRSKAEALCRSIEAQRSCRVAESVQDAVKNADIIVTATSSKEPVLLREWIPAGAHINAVGSSIAAARELDSAAMAASSLFVDRRESTINESGDFLFAVREGAITSDHIRAEIGEILIGKASGRTSASEVTLFKSLGLAIEDLAAAEYLHAKAQRVGGGTWLEI